VAITDITPETESLLEQFVVDEKLTCVVCVLAFCLKFNFKRFFVSFNEQISNWNC
jgi:hypothetical protein